MENLVSEKDQENVDTAALDYKRCHKCWETWRALNCWPVEEIGIPSGRVTVSDQEVAASNQPLKVNPPDRFLETYKVAKRAGLLDVI